jgi:H+/Cl- antiporter ClcA
MDVSRQIAGEARSRADARGAGWRDAFIQFLGVVSPPLVMLIALEVVYGLTPTACQRGIWWILPLITASGIALCAAALVATLKQFRRYDAPDAEDDASVERARFLAAVGILSAIMSILVLVAMGIATLILNPCER